MLKYAVETRPFMGGDLALLSARGIRGSDIREAERASGMHYMDAIIRSLNTADEAYTLLAHGRVTALVGVGAMPSQPWRGLVWLVAHQDFELPQFAVPMARACKMIIDGWSEKFSILENMVDPFNEKNLAFLRWLGFNIETTPVLRDGGYRLVRFWKQTCA